MSQQQDSQLVFETQKEREISGNWKKFVFILTAFMAISHMYILGFYPIDPWIIRIVHLQFAVILGFLYFPGWKSSKKVHIIDLAFILLSLGSLYYVLDTFDKLIFRAGVFPLPLDVLFGIFAIITVLELTRRSTGFGLVIVVIVFLLYCFIGPYLPAVLWHKGYSFERVVSFLFSTNGIYNAPLGASAQFVYLFVLFGAFLQICGTGKFFMDFSYLIAGRTRGGPAKIAVISSGLFGMINGTSVGNVVTTGSFTIPLMKRIGYSGSFAGSVEACASTGGQIMPPVMGAAAFLMAQLIGIPYVEIMFAAIIPAMLYYYSVYLMVDLEAARLGLSGLTSDQIPPAKDVLKTSYLALPLFVVIYFLTVVNTSITLVGIIGIASALLIGFAVSFYSDNKLTLNKILEACLDGGKNIVSVAATCAAAGMVMGVLTLTGLGMRVATIVINLAQGELLVALFLTMLVCIVLGMGLPTIAAYAITASVVAPALIEMGVSPMATHMFVLYYACLSAITPPVALASYAAAALAGVKPMKLAMVALKLGLAGFIIPFMFVYGPAMLLIGTTTEIIIATITALIGVFALATAIQGFLWGKVPTALRIVLFIAALALIKPGLLTDAVGISLLAGSVAIQYYAAFKKRNLLKDKPDDAQL